MTNSSVSSSLFEPCPSTHTLQRGQVLWHNASHLLTHSRWNKCRHGNFLVAAPPAKLDKQTQQSSSSSKALFGFWTTTFSVKTLPLNLRVFITNDIMLLIRTSTCACIELAMCFVCVCVWMFDILYLKRVIFWGS